MKTGDVFTWTERPGYLLTQERSLDCRWSCNCGRCNGVLTEYRGTIDRVIGYADNSTEVVVSLTDGKKRTVMVANPGGDVC